LGWAPFISEGVASWDLLRLDLLCRILALAALRRLSHIAPLYALSTFYVSLIAAAVAAANLLLLSGAALLGVCCRVSWWHYAVANCAYMSRSSARESRA
jgi:hypothetical protein